MGCINTRYVLILVGLLAYRYGNWYGTYIRYLIYSIEPVARSSLETSGSNLGPVKSDTVIPTACHQPNTSSKEAVLPADIMTWR